MNEPTFIDYVLGEEFEARSGTDVAPERGFAEFRQRLSRADIRVLRVLLTWVRERYPDFFYRTHGTGTGKKIMQHAWADYLRWSEL